MLEAMLKNAQAAQKEWALSHTQVRNDALEQMIHLVRRDQDKILSANRRDLDAASELPKALANRLALSPEGLSKLLQGLKVVIDQPDPLGTGMGQRTLPNGLSIEAIRVPLGTIGLIFESRPGVAIEAVALALKAGNAMILRSGHEAKGTVAAIVACWQEALTKTGFRADLVQQILDPDRKYVDALLHLRGLDLLIPRGGPALIQKVVAEATVPVIETGVGNCHVYVDRQADLDMAVNIVINAKVSNPAVCNAAETVLVHQDIAEQLLPELAKALSAQGVQLHADSRALSLVPGAVLATNEDFAKEYLSLDLAVRVVANIDEAIAHIEQYGTKHSETIVTNDYSQGERFLKMVDAAAVYINASTRFTDGYQFGFGGEVGISTQKLHARGPMGLEALTTWKWVGRGHGQIRS
ncbi:glutamate-5-semialdehyde dehydrogenase [Sulfobacillus thermotolerans]|uniref:Gamma-glutamyl phosphate reductase n=1 Tax=Sulfobacillus thermotolerans TaxID=338644 RepID=A0ABN5GYL2_9FIRM|nr:glutamate-5-semialdehyde dehydrogenase [Sulfobacillus thermotolerans]